jgi:hypothetical protein
MSGNTDFWHNDLFNRIDHPSPGNNLFGADRAIVVGLKGFAKIALSG